MKRIIAILMLALPLGVLAKSASAAEFNVNHGQNSTRSGVVEAGRVAPDRLAQNQREETRRNTTRRVRYRRVWVAGHYQPTSRGHRRWVPGHWVNRRV
ncbi:MULTISPECIES: hypothetical protein [unclassified Nostoc]|uniref:hypothetical protein n=1 Tax=unclassified Nostoc TaxID=2593658 RepID=UPI000B955FA5|nr:hypothetical protein [Nostoc sp. 'Peltigera membranacea cyanobiont' 232]OYE00578.1 hypothetical protein CDG79_34315 [Nostoc sp. 'Peltigera membranacea cyanobiont' 232]